MRKQGNCSGLTEVCSYASQCDVPVKISRFLSGDFNAITFQEMRKNALPVSINKPPTILVEYCSPKCFNQLSDQGDGIYLEMCTTSRHVQHRKTSFM